MGLLPLQAQPWRLAASKDGNGTQRRPCPQTSLFFPHADAVQGPVYWAADALTTARIEKRVVNCMMVVVM